MKSLRMFLEETCEIYSIPSNTMGMGNPHPTGEPLAGTIKSKQTKSPKRSKKRLYRGRGSR